MPRRIGIGSGFGIFTPALCLVLAGTFPNPVRGQQQPSRSSPQPPATSLPTPSLPADPQDPVFRVTADLVQADVIVVDRQGRLVDNLRREDFELRVDDRPQAISFFERVQAGLLDDDIQLPAVGGAVTPPSSTGEPAARPRDSGRTVLFFVDDFHLSHPSLERARHVLTGFVDREMRLNDLAAIASTSGQTGFLQQLTGNKAVLRAAVERLRNRTPAAMDVEIPPMTTHQAYILERGSDRDLLGFFVRETQRVHPFLPRDAAENIVLGRAHRIVEQSDAITSDTLSALESLVRSVSDLSGRKVVFFLSDGFLINLRGMDTANRLQRIADAAARSRVTVYSIDARGLAALPDFDASRPAVFDPTAIVSRTSADEISLLQEPLQRLAVDTGGRAMLNSNALAAAIPRALQETSVYYLLGWMPEQEGHQDNHFHRIEVSVRGRPEWTVRVPRGFYDAPPTDEQRTAPSSRRRGRSATSTGAAEESPADAALLSALRSAHPVTTLPASLRLSFSETPSTGTVLTVSTELNASTLDFGSSEGSERQAVVDVITSVFSDQGQGVSTVKERLTVSFSSMSSTRNTTSRRVIYRHQFQMKPGLYQVRTAARDSGTGRVGSAMEWIEIPNLSGGPLSLSSLVLGERASDASQGEANAAASAAPMEVSAGHHFGRGPRLRFLTYIYNAAHANAVPDVVLKVQVSRDEKPLMVTPFSRLRTDGIEDLSRIPYLGEVNLEGMPGGRYVLQVTAIDRTAQTIAAQRTDFEIE